MSAVTVYTKDGCPDCHGALSALEAFEVPFKEVSLSDDRLRQMFYDACGFEGADRTVPKAFDEDGNLIGGLSDLTHWIAAYLPVATYRPVDRLARTIAEKVTGLPADTPLWEYFISVAEVALSQ